MGINILRATDTATPPVQAFPQLESGKDRMLVLALEEEEEWKRLHAEWEERDRAREKA